MKKLCGLMAALILIAGQTLSASRVEAQDQPLKVVATFSVLADLAANVGGDAVEITTLAGVNADAHTFEPAPEQVVALADAELIFENGLGFEPWLDGIVDAARPDASRIVVSDGIELRSAEEDHHGGAEHADEGEHQDEEGHEEEGEHADGEEHADEHDHGDFDPHVWQSAANAMIMVENIRDALIDADPDNAAVYEDNAAAYLTILQELDASIMEQVSTIPEDQRKLVTSHDTFGYFADRYGFEVIGTPLGVSTETSDPAAGEIAELIELIQAAGVPAIFTENVQSDSLMQQIANDAGVKVAPPLYTDALGDEESGAASYLEMMRFNTETIVQALSR